MHDDERTERESGFILPLLDVSSAMNSKRKPIAVALAAAMVLMAVAPAAASTGAATDSLTITATQSGDGVNVTVAHNDSAVANASVAVEAVNDSTYAGAGNYTTDANGTVSLPSPERNVTVRITATKGNRSGSTTVALTVDETDTEEAFGQRVSGLVHRVMSANDTNGSLGEYVSEFVTANNPGADEKADNANGNGGENGKRGGDHGEEKGNGKDKGNEKKGGTNDGHGKGHGK